MAGAADADDPGFGARRRRVADPGAAGPGRLQAHQCRVRPSGRRSRHPPHRRFDARDPAFEGAPGADRRPGVRPAAALPDRQCLGTTGPAAAHDGGTSVRGRTRRRPAADHLQRRARLLSQRRQRRVVAAAQRRPPAAGGGGVGYPRPIRASRPTPSRREQEWLGLPRPAPLAYPARVRPMAWGAN